MSDDYLTNSYALSPEQRALISMFDDGQPETSTVSMVLTINERLDVAKLKTIVEQRIQVHTSLHTSFNSLPGLRSLRMQACDIARPIVWYERDLRSVAKENIELSDYHDEICSDAFAITDGELLRIGLLRLGEQRYVLIIVACSLIVDSGSLLALSEQFVADYRNQVPIDTETLFQYTQFVQWRESINDDEDAEQGCRYWQNYLADHNELTSPKLVYRQLSQSNYSSAEDAYSNILNSEQKKRIHCSVAVDHVLMAELCNVTENSSSSLSILMQCAWWLLLARITQFHTFIGGWQHDCRQDYSVMSGAVGVFEKIIPIIVDINPGESFAQSLKHLDGVLHDHVAAQEYLAIDAPVSNAHFDIGFAFYQTCCVMCHPCWDITELPGPMPCFELALQVDWDGCIATLSVYANNACYSRQAIERLLEQYTTLLAGISKDPNALVSLLPVIGPHEREALLSINNVQLDIGNKTLIDAVAKWAVQVPDAQAVAYGTIYLTYSQLYKRANQMARWLLAQGVKRGDLIALNLPRTTEAVIAILATWRIGAAYLPLDPGWPEQRCKTVLIEASPVLLIGQIPLTTATSTGSISADIQSASYCQGDWQYVDIHDISLEEFSDAFTSTFPMATDTAYVLYTSGSTGKPKGVIIEHGQLSNYIIAASQAMQLDQCRQWAWTSPLAADLGHTMLFAALFNGACLVIADDRDINNPQAFNRFIDSGTVDVVKMVPSHLDALLDAEFTHLPQTIILGGESPSPALIKRIKAIAPDSTVYNHYGPTEATVGVIVHHILEPAGIQPIPLTQVLANNHILVLDNSRQLVPSGGMGEIYIGGAQVSRGYISNEFHEVFIQCPLSGTNERYYRTGDLAYVLPDGGICLAGRADYQINIRGFRVELAEVEAALQIQQGVSQAVVLGQQDAVGDWTLVAYLIMQPGIEENADMLRKKLTTLLPAYMMPVHYQFLNRLPRLGNDKVDRQALAALREVTITTNALLEKEAAEKVTPRNSVEFVLLHFLKDLLKRKNITIKENIFKLGAHSLQIIKLAARIQKTLHIDIVPEVIFDYPNIAELATFLIDHNVDKGLMDRANTIQKSLVVDEV